MAGEDEEEDEDDEDDDEDEEEEEPVRPVHRPHTLLDRVDLAALIVRRFSAGWTSMSIFRWLRRKNIASAETREYLSIRHISGFKSLMRRRKPPIAFQQWKEQVPAPQGITDEERAGILRNLKRTANFIAAKDDPILKTRALFSIGDHEDRKQGLFLAIIGRERLINAARRLIREYEGLGEYSLYVLACDSPDGRAWIDASFKEIKLQARLSGFLLKKEEAGAFLDKLEALMGFLI